MILKNELKPSDEDCADFLNTLWNFFDNMYPQELTLFKQASEIFANATNELQDRRGDFAFYAGFCYMIVGNDSVASLNEDKALRIRKNILPENSPILAQSTNIEDLQNMANVCANVSSTYLERGNSERGLIFAKKALEIFEKHPPQNLYEKALTLTKKALQIFEEKLPPNHFEISQTYSFISKIYKSLGDTESQNFYSQKFHSILYENQKKIAIKKLNLALEFLEENSQNITSADLTKYNRDAAESYKFLNQLDEAQKFILASIKNILPTTDASDKYLTYFSASKIFADSEKLDEAINFAEKSLTAAEILQDKFSVLSTLHFHLGELYSKIGKHEISLKTFLAALEVQQNLAEPEISFVLILKKAAGNEFLALKNFAQAEKIFFEVLSEQLKFLPEFHSDVQITKNLLNFARNKISIMY